MPLQQHRCLIVPVFLILMLTAVAQAQSRAPFEHAFGMHGPQYSHWLGANEPHTWLRGDARLRVLADTGAGWARQDFWWGLVEPKKGTFKWDDFDRAIASYERSGVNLLVILCYGSAWGDNTAPQNEQQIKEFGEYVYQMVRRYKDKVQAWEIWNEPNLLPYWSPQPDPEIYAKLLIESYQRAKEADPNSYIVGGALAGPDVRFMERMYEHGVAGHFDAFSYHNYGQALDMTTEWPAVQEMRQLMAKHGDGDKPLWHTETGFYTGSVGLSPNDQAARMVRYSLGLRALGISKTFQLTINDWSDDPQFHDLSSYRGMTHNDYRIKPSYHAYQAMCNLFGTAKFVGLFRPAVGVTGLLFKENDHYVAAVWRDWETEPAKFTFDTDQAVLLTRDLMGNWQRHESPDGTYSFMLGKEPLYLVDPGEKIINQALIDWPGVIHTELPREKQVPLTMSVRNPWEETVKLAVYSDARRSRKLVETKIPEKPASKITYTVDASRWEVGWRELYWEITALRTGKVLVSGYWPVEVASPIDLEFAPLPALDPEQPQLPVKVTYRGTEPADARVALVVGDQRVAEKAIVLKPGDVTQVLLGLPTDAFADGAMQKLALQLESESVALEVESERRLLTAPAAPANAKIDGDLSEWLSRPPQIRPEKMTWKYINTPVAPGPEDLTVTGWVGYDRRGLWLAVRVQDDKIVPPESRAVWNWDSLQVGLDLAADSRPGVGYDGNDLEIELAGSEEQIWCYLGAWPVGWPHEPLNEKLRGTVRIDREAGIVDYELLVPLEIIGSVTQLEPESVLGFSIMVNDNDADGRAGWQELTPGIGLGKEPENFAWLWLR